MGRLFWKIFGWFWFAMILVVLGVGFGVASFDIANDHLPDRPDPMDRPPPFDRPDSPGRHGPGQPPKDNFFIADTPARIATILRRQGLDAALSAARLEESEKPVTIRIADVTETLLDEPVPHNSKPGIPHPRWVTLADGRRFEITAEPTATWNIMWFASRVLGIPMPALVNAPELFFVKIALAVVISGLVCFWLAWYITRPLSRLSEATRKVSAGDLSARATGIPESRNDEIVDLSRDFNQMTAQLEALLCAQKRLLNDVSHELRSPLTRLKLAVELTRRTANSQTNKLLDRVDLESDRLEQLIGQLLTLSRLQAGTFNFPEEAVDLEHLLDEIILDANFEGEFQKKRVDLDVKTTAVVCANNELLRQAIENVVRNGLKYSPNGGTVNVLLKAGATDPKSAVIEIRDAGPGIPTESLSSIFDPFVRLPEKAGKRRSGYGLGLSIAKRVILMYGGSIEAFNRKDLGLCVRVTLPVAPPSDAKLRS